MKTGFTIATANYLAQAKAAADSLVKHNPEYRFIIVLLDRINNRFDPSFFRPAQIIEVEYLNIQWFHEMAERYTLFELSNALKPFVAENLLLNYVDTDTLIYLDSDILVYNSFAHIENTLDSYSIVITPHTLTPIPSDGFYPEEKLLFKSGIYNGGFFALNRSNVSMDFLSWWKQRLRTDCLVDLSKGLYVDQMWLNLVPLYFENAVVIKNPGYNIAYWNFHERHISFSDSTYTVNNQFPVVFFHFSGYDFSKTELISKYQNRYKFESRKDILPLFEHYNNIVKNNRYNEFSQFECFFARQKIPAKVKCLKSRDFFLKRVLELVKAKMISLKSLFAK